MKKTALIFVLLFCSTGFTQNRNPASIIPAARCFPDFDPKSDVLYVLDGVPVKYEVVSKLEQDKIESMTLLKDSAATAISCNTKRLVIIIKTKIYLTQEDISKLQKPKRKAKLRDSAFVRRPISKNPYK